MPWQARPSCGKPGSKARFVGAAGLTAQTVEAASWRRTLSAQTRCPDGAGTVVTLMWNFRYALPGRSTRSQCDAALGRVEIRISSHGDAQCAQLVLGALQSHFGQLIRVGRR